MRYFLNWFVRDVVRFQLNLLLSFKSTTLQVWPARENRTKGESCGNGKGCVPLSREKIRKDKACWNMLVHGIYAIHMPIIRFGTMWWGHYLQFQLLCPISKFLIILIIIIIMRYKVNEKSLYFITHFLLIGRPSLVP